MAPVLNRNVSQQRVADDFSSRRATSKSLFSDDLWLLDGLPPNAPWDRSRINWSFALDEKENFGGEKYLSWKISAKKFIYGLTHGELGSGIMKHATAASKYTNLRRLIRFMYSRGCRAFRDISDTLLADYYIELRRTSLQHGPEAANSLVRQLIELGDFIGDQIVVRREIEVDARPSDVEGIPFIPDDVALPLVKEACRWIFDLADPIIDLKERRRVIYNDALAKLNSDRVAREALLKFTHCDELEVEIRGSAVNIGTMHGTSFHAIVYDLISACYIVLFAFIGLRVSELAALQIDCLTSKEIEGLQTLIISSDLYKTDPIAHRRESWIAGPDVSQNPVRRAVEVLTALFASERKATGSRLLFPLFNMRHVTKGGEGRKQRQIIDLLRNVLKRHVETNTEWSLSPHQFRKTFARFVARNETNAMEALQRHFKHVSLVMTAHYIGRDLGILEEVQDEMTRFTEEILDSIIGAEYLAGKLGAEIASRNHAFRGLAGKDARTEYIRLLLQNSDLSILLHRYGVCIYRAEGANCGGRQERVGVNTCLPCRNFSVGVQHLPYWEERRDSLASWAKELPETFTSIDRSGAIVAEIDKAISVISLITASCESATKVEAS